MTSDGEPAGRTALHETQRALVTGHLWLAEALALELAWLRHKTVDGNVSQPAYEGLAKAAQRFDPSSGEFVPYARKWILGEIFRAVDAMVPGFSRRYGPAAELSGEAGEEGSDDGACDELDHAAVVMCIAAESLRRARGEPTGLCAVLHEELSRFPEKKRRAFLGWALDGATWEELAAETGASASSVKRWSREVRLGLLARLSERRRRA